MPRYKITIEYDGTHYCGWQEQNNAPTIQNSIENSIKKFNQSETSVFCAGRTDAGVHAYGQVAHFDLPGQIINEETVVNALNFYLKPEPIVILKCQKVSDDFHARFSAKKRSYEYCILNRATSPAIGLNRVWHISSSLNINEMQKAANHLIGNHDFSSFRASQCQAASPIKTIDEIKLSKHGELIKMEITAQSFLHHMVRNIIGTLALVGQQKISLNHFKDILNARDRKKAGVTAPACGLFFKNVQY